jgi:hypothetical protein
MKVTRNGDVVVRCDLRISVMYASTLGLPDEFLTHVKYGL